MYVAKMRKINIFIKITTLIALFFVCICSNLKYSYSKDLFNTKNYSTIGINRSVTIEKINKFFFGANIYWIFNRFDGGKIENVDVKHNAIRNTGFTDYFKNLSLHLGWRANKYFAVEFGYLRFGNLKDLVENGTTFNGFYGDIIAFAQIASLKWTTFESYVSVGYFYTKCSETKKHGNGFKAGLGVQAKIYGPLAIKIGIDYYYPGNESFSKKGFLTLKTGLDLYFNV